MYDLMNEGNMSFLNTYVENIGLTEIDVTKMKRLIDEWPKDIKISIKGDVDKNSDMIFSADSKKIKDATTKNKDGTFTLIPEGPPVEKVDIN